MKNIAIVTGASSGIGKEFFLSLCDKKQELDEIWVAARSDDKLNALKALSPIPLRVFALDLSQNEAVTTLGYALQAETPSVQYLICASGFGRFCAVEEDDSTLLQNMIDLNCKSIVSLTKAVSPFMKAGGAILLVASVAAFQPIPYIATYAASKAFVLSYGRALDKELRKGRNARCLTVSRSGRKRRFSTAPRRKKRS